jgi:hypothetical protein
MYTYKSSFQQARKLSDHVCVLRVSIFLRFYNFSIRCWTCWESVVFCFPFIIHFNNLYLLKGRRGRDRVVVGFTTTYVISAYHHLYWDFESRSRRGVQLYVIKFVSDLRQVGGFLRVLRFPPQIKRIATI